MNHHFISARAGKTRRVAPGRPTVSSWISALLGLLLLLLVPGTRADAQIKNPGFDSGDLFGWKFEDGFDNTTLAADAVEKFASPFYTPMNGSHFAILSSAIQDVWMRLSSEKFAAQTGETLSGYAFFQTDDTLRFNDEGEVVIQASVPDGQGGTTWQDIQKVFRKTVNDVGNYGRLPWTRWEHTFTSGGIYRVQARVINRIDDALASTIGLDALRLEVMPVDNRPPALNPIGSQSVDEGATLRFDAFGLDPDTTDTLIYSLDQAPAGATINSATGAFSWTPTEAQGPGAHTFRVVVRDGRIPLGIDSEEITVTVREINTPPVFDSGSDPLAISVNEGDPVTFTASATDGDLPANTLTYSLIGAPAGATINPTTGAFSWTTTEAQGPGTYAFTVRVTDNGSPSFAREKSITVAVAEVNAAPVLAAIGNRTVDEETPLTFKAGGSDADLPANALTYSLIGAPAGATINPTTGAFSWTPTEAQGPETYTFTVRVTDNGSPARSAQETITVRVAEINKAPVLSPIGNKAVKGGQTLTFTASATDGDLPANTLTYSLAGAPAGATINPTTGAFSWTTTDQNGSGSFTFTVRVTDNGSPARSAQETITVGVNVNNKKPKLNPIGDKTIDEEKPLTFTATASDPEGSRLTFSLRGKAPEGATIDPATGAFSWTPTEAQGPETYTFSIQVTDNGAPALSDEEKITVTVKEVNKAPVLAPVGIQAVSWGNPVAFTVSAADADLPANKLTYSAVGLPRKASFNAGSGGFSWQPTSSDIGTYTVKFVVTDDGSPARSDEKQVTIQVTSRTTRLQYQGAQQAQTSDVVSLRARLLDDDGTALRGYAVNFQIGTQTASAVTNASGVAQTALRVDGAPGALDAAVQFAGDAGYFGSTDANFRSFQVLQEDARVIDPEPLLLSTIRVGPEPVPVTLRATVEDITAVPDDPAYDPTAGDITNARVTFSVYPDAGPVISGDAPVILEPSSDLMVGTATFPTKLDLGQSAGRVFMVGMRVSGHYTRDTAYDNTLITVFRSLPDFLVGDGYLVNSRSSRGLYAGDAGEKTHFGLAVKFDGDVSSWSGQAALLLRSGGRVYEVRTSTIASLGVSRGSRQNRVVLDGLASIRDITDPKTPVLVDSGALLTLTLADARQAGNSDTLGITLRRSDGALYFSSREQPLNGGDLQVR